MRSKATGLVSHQTVRLSKGRHPSPAAGMCVMELASVLAGEPFTDHPRSVSPVIGAFLRAYNDLTDDRRRQDLKPLAADAVGTRGRTQVELARLARCREWIEQRGAELPWWRWRARRAASRAQAGHTAAQCAGWAARLASLGDAAAHGSALSLVAELASVGRAPAAPSAPAATGSAATPQAAAVRLVTMAPRSRK